MAESLPTPKSYYRVKGSADDSWNLAVDGEFQAESGVEYEVCCVKPSEFTTKTWTEDVSVVAVPAEFGLAVPFSIYKTAPQTYTTDLDNNDYVVASEVTYYVANDGNDGNDGLSVEAPKKSLSLLVAALNASPPSGATIYIAPGVYTNVDGFNGASIGFDANFICEGGHAEISRTQPVTWNPASATYPNCWLSSATQRSDIESKNYLSVFDRTQVDSDGNVPCLRRVATTADLNIEPGVVYIGSSAILVRLFDERQPDSNVVVCDVAGPVIQQESTQNLYFNRVNLVGGSNCLKFSGQTSEALYFFNNCTFNYSAVLNAIEIETDTVASARFMYLNCEANYNVLDGFSYRGGASGFEIGCASKHNGQNIFTEAENGSTAHNSSKVIRVNGSYIYNGDRNVHDIESTQTFMVGTDIGYATSGSADKYLSGNYVAGRPGQPDATQAWLYGCTSLGGSASDVCAYGASTVTLSDCVGFSITDTDGTAEIIVM